MIQKKELKKFRQHIRGLEREIAIQLKEDTGCCGVSLAHCHALMEMVGCDEISVTELAENLELDKSTLSRTVESMVASGMVTREANKADRRQAILRVTPEGHAAIDRINKTCDDYYKELFKCISVEKHDIIVEAVELLATAMKKIRISTTGEAKKCQCDRG
ncbi:MAG TPA: MarR family transcriptional regulator [Candidatus Wallbacteria bacterium]|nr:MarR family transcriptional regulator [Candidatus Wallbacteria bacterium]